MTTMTDSNEVVCTVCGRPELPGIIHGPGGEVQHPFTTEDQPDWVPPRDRPKKSVEKTQGPVTRQMVIAPMPDLALRSLLVAKGVITNEELKEAENALRFPGGADSVPSDPGDTR